MGQSFPIDELSGLPANDEQFTVGSVKFELRREAGTLAFEGAFRDGRGAGLFTFAPRAAYIGRDEGARVQRRPAAVAALPARASTTSARRTSAT